MKSQIQPSRWSCLPTSFAIALEIEVKEIFDFLGHDGSEILRPNLPEREKRRGFHLQEMIDFTLTIPFRFPIHIETTPIFAINVQQCLVNLGNSLEANDLESSKIHFAELTGRVHFINNPTERIEYYLDNYKGVLIGRTKIRGHAVAWDGNLIYDPTNGTASAIEDFDFHLKEMCLIL